MSKGRKRFLSALTAAGLALCLMTGCEKKARQDWTPDRTAVQISQDGTLTETIIDTLNQSYYSPDELSSMIKSSISDYTAEHGAGTVREGSWQTEHGQVMLVLTYASAKDYRDFNHIPFFNGSMLNAEMAGYEFNQSFLRVEDGKTGDTMDNKEPLSHKEYQVLVTDFSHAVQVPGKITYISSNAQLLDAYTAVPDSGAASETEAPASQEAQSEAEGSAAGIASAASAGDGLLYIIYDF